MENNDAIKKHSCPFCNFVSKRKYDLTRHQNAKHIQMVTPAAEVMDSVASVASGTCVILYNSSMIYL